MNYPLKNYLVTQRFGERITDPLGHTGIDLWQPVGTPVYAAEGGDVLATGIVNNSYADPLYGRIVFIDHKNGYYTLYAHLDKILVQTGQSVLAGTQIGTVGLTGNTTGPHLHFEVRTKPTWNRSNFIDPESVCGPAGNKPNVIQTPISLKPNLKNATKVKVANDILNMRDAAGYTGKIIAQLKRGAKLTIVGDKINKDGLEWYPVQLQGYVASSDGFTTLLEKDE